MTYTRMFVNNTISFVKYCIWNTGFIFFLCLDNIHGQPHALTENLRTLSAEVRSKLQDHVVVSLEGGIAVDQLLRGTQLTDVVNKILNV